MSRRTASQPPEIPGFTYLQLLGSGGFADVFLYEQRLPRRRVAVKVLLPDRISTSTEQFTAEANVMAMLSTHPSIVTIYQAGVAGDGRPYLVMEYCPRPNLQVRYRREPFAVGEALHTGIPVAAAVETAHRANVLHRDIKPANILVTEYNRPALTDFGIASTMAQPDESQGVSIPWSPPESFADPPRSDPSSDVYQLGATVYTLLAGRSPFEVPGESNSSNALIDRIERLPLPELQRDDVPASLRAVLEKAMAKDPSRRYRSAVAFARALQKVQIELGHPVTQIDILDDHPDDVPFDDDDVDDIGSTRIRRLQGSTVRAPVEPEPPAASPAPAVPAPGPAQPFEIPQGEQPVDHSAFAPPSDAGADGSTEATPDIPLIDGAPEAGSREDRGSAETRATPAPDQTAAPSRRPDRHPAEEPAPQASSAGAPSQPRAASSSHEPPAGAGQAPVDETIIAPRRAGSDQAPGADDTVASPLRVPGPAPEQSVDDRTIASPSRAPRPDQAPVDDRTVARPGRVPDQAPVDDRTVARPGRAPDQAPVDDRTVARPARAPEPAVDETVARPRAAQPDPLPDATALRPHAEPPAWAQGSGVPDQTIARSGRPAATPAEAPVEYSFGRSIEIDASSVPKADPSQFKVASRTTSTGSVTRAPAAQAVTPRKRNWPLIVGIGAAATAVVGGIIIVGTLMDGDGDAPVVQRTPDTVRDVPPVTDLQGTIEGDEVTFTWTNDAGELGDSYIWGVAATGKPTDYANETGSTDVTIPLQAGDQTCIEVILVRGDGNQSPYESACVDNPGAE